MESLICLYQKAEILTDNQKAEEIFRHIIDTVLEKTAEKSDNTELKAAALSCMKMFIISKFTDTAFADMSIKYFEALIDRNACDAELYDSYVFVLETSYQYEKAFCVLKNMLLKKDTKITALKYLQSPVYAIEGLQTNRDCMEYKKHLIELTGDETKKSNCKKN